MNGVLNYFQGIKYENLVASIVIILASLILYKFSTFIFNKSEKNLKNKKSKTYVKLIKSVLRYFFIILTALILLETNGVNVSSLLTGVGIAGAILGLAIQDWIKDIIRGSTILSDTYFSVGDIVKFNEIEGKVIEIGLKTTKIQALKTGNVLSVANRNIEVIEKVSNLVYVNIPMPYEVDLKKAEKVVGSIVERVKEKDNVYNCTYKGVNELADSFIKYLIEIECDVSKKLQVNRDANRAIIEVYEKNGLEVPYTQIDIHNK